MENVGYKHDWHLLACKLKFRILLQESNIKYFYNLKAGKTCQYHIICKFLVSRRPWVAKQSRKLKQSCMKIRKCRLSAHMVFSVFSRSEASVNDIPECSIERIINRYRVARFRHKLDHVNRKLRKLKKMKRLNYFLTRAET